MSSCSGAMQWAMAAMVSAAALAGCFGGGGEDGSGEDDGDDVPEVTAGINETIPLVEYPIQRIEGATALGFTFTDNTVLIVRLQADAGLELEGASHNGDEAVGWGFLLLDVEQGPDVADPCRPLNGVTLYHSGFGGQPEAERGTGFYDLWVWGDGAVTLDFNGEAEAPAEPFVYRSDWAFSVTDEAVEVGGPPASASFEMPLQVAAPGWVLARWEP